MQRERKEHGIAPKDPKTRPERTQHWKEWFWEPAGAEFNDSLDSVMHQLQHLICLRLNTIVNSITGMQESCQ